MPSWMQIAIYVALGVVGLCLIFGSIYTIETQHVGIIQRFGKFLRVAHPGLNFKFPFVDSVVDHLSLQIDQLVMKAESKTKDNVYISLPIAIQFRVNPLKVFEAYYTLDDPEPQIKAYVANCILGHVPNMTLAEVFEKQSSISADVQTSLNASMAQFGYDIVRAQVTDISPPADVVAAMNDIVAAVSARTAAESRAEMNKMIAIKAAEAEAESKRLQGTGVANERAAIIEGLSKSIKEFEDAVSGATADQALMMVLLTQYFDTLKAVGANARSNTILLPSGPGGVSDIAAQLREATALGNIIGHVAKPA